jgi:hypothetical protein
VAAGRRRSPATLPGCHAGRAPSDWPGTARASSSTWLTWSSAAVTQQLACLRHFYEADRSLVLPFERCRRDTLAQYRRRVEFRGVRDRGFAPRRVRRRAAGKPEALLVAALRKLGLPAGTRWRVMDKLTGGRPAAVRPRRCGRIFRRHCTSRSTPT